MSTADELYSFANLHRQYRACRGHKRGTVNALAFEVDAEANLLGLQEKLRAHTYRPGPSICFISRGPKAREVFAADFRDRIVHHVLVDRQEPVFERRFSRDSFACRKGKGTLAASDRLMVHLRGATANGRRAAWALKLDVASFFPSIDKQILYERIASAMRDPELLWLTLTTLFHDPTLDYRFRCLDRHMPPPGSPGYPVPERKSLFGKDGQRGLPWLDALYSGAERCRATPRWSLVDRASDAAARRCPYDRAGRPLSSYGERYRRLTRHAGDRCLVFWPVGRYIEFHGPQRLLAERLLGLRRVAIVRGEYALAAGFPRALAPRFVARAIEGRMAVATVVDWRRSNHRDGTQRKCHSCRRGASGRLLDVAREPASLGSGRAAGTETRE